MEKRVNLEQQVLREFETTANKYKFIVHKGQGTSNRITIVGNVYFQFGDLRVETPANYIIIEAESAYRLILKRGTRVTCENGCSFCITTVPSKLRISLFHELPTVPYNQAVVSPACDLIGYFGSERCEGVTFEPPAESVWKYNPSGLPEGISEEDMVFAYYNKDSNEWSNMGFVIDLVDNSITAEASHFSVFAVLGFITPSVPPIFEVSPTQPAPSPGVTSLPPSIPPPVQLGKVQQSGISWPILGAILGVGAFLIVFLLSKIGRRSSNGIKKSSSPRPAHRRNAVQL